MFTSCESEVTVTTSGTDTETESTTTQSSGDIVKDQIFGLIADADKGLKPLSPIANIDKYDANTKAYIVGEKETGNFNSKWEKGDYEGSRFYSKKYNDDSQLSEVRLSIMVKEEIYYDDESDTEDESKKIDCNKYLKIISEKLGVEAEEETYTGGGHVWKTPIANWQLTTYDDYSLQFVMKESK